MAPAHILLKQEVINIDLFVSKCDYFTIIATYSQATNMLCSYPFKRDPQHKVISLHCSGGGGGGDLPTPKRSETVFVQGAMTAFNVLPPTPHLSDSAPR